MKDVHDKQKKPKSSTQSGVSVPVGTQTPVSIENITEILRDIGETRGWIFKVVLAVYLSTFIDQDEPPIWLMLVGAPSSNKTTLVDLLKKSQDIYRLDTMTANPFSSGQKEENGREPKDLLPLLDKKCFIIKEYATLLGRSDEMVKQLLSDFVSIYDGEYVKHSPTRGTIPYESHFSHIGCVTPMAIQKRQNYMNMVGARFLFLRIPHLSDHERRQQLQVMWEENTEKKTKDEIAEIVATFCRNRVASLNQIHVSFPSEIREKLGLMSEFIARARGSISHDTRTYQITDSQIEEPFRAMKQIKKLIYALTLVNGKAEVGEEEMRIIFQVVFSSMPVQRADICGLFEAHSNLTAGEISCITEKHEKTVRRHLEDLVHLRILQKHQGKNDRASVYFLNPKFELLFSSINTSQKKDLE